MGRRRFSHLHTELSLAVGQVVPRYALWLDLAERGWNPERLTRAAVIAFSDHHLHRFLAAQRLSLSARAARRLRRALMRFDPLQPTPEERMERLAGLH